MSFILSYSLCVPTKRIKTVFLMNITIACKDTTILSIHQINARKKNGPCTSLG